MKDRREFLKKASCIGVGAFVGVASPELSHASQISEDRNRPNITHGIASGDITNDSAIIWSRADRPSRMIVEVAATEAFKNPRRIYGPNALVNTDYTAKLRLNKLAAGDEVFYRVVFQDLANPRLRSLPKIGRFKTASNEARSIKFGWSGDTAGQGFGIDVARGGMKSYETMRNQNFDFFVHSGDVCYADGPFPSEQKLDDGTAWKNLTTEATSKVAETLDEFRGNFQYNLLDENLKSFNAEVPVFYQWDDHETTNNWYPGEQLVDDDRYSVKSASLLAARGRQAFFEYLPIRPSPRQQIYRQATFGPLLDLFFLDLRSYRGKNSTNRQEARSHATAFLGKSQLDWLKTALANSKAEWKFICSDMPIGLQVRDGMNFENGANGNGPALGRELEIADLLHSIKSNQVGGVVFITADVHYAASHFYDPNLAQFQDFNPFWEFVSGPLHAGTFGPGQLDNTFGPQQKFCSIPSDMKPNRPPSEGLQFFGSVTIDGESKVCRVEHFNRAGEKLWGIELGPTG